MTNTEDPIVIVGAARTPIADFQGVFTSLQAPELGAVAIKAALERSKISQKDVNEVFMGCILPAGLGQAPARQASLASGIPDFVGCTTVNKMCGSGMKTVMLAHDLLLAGNGNVIVAGGMESMTNSPYLLKKARSGYRLGHGTLIDHMFLDGLEDAYDKGKLMGVFAETTAEKYGFTRKAQDEFALNSLTRARQATHSGWFISDVEITPVHVQSNKVDVTITQDEHPENVKSEKIPVLKPSFKENGTVTPANSSAISDGAAALVLTRMSYAKKYNLPIKAKILGHASFAQASAWFTTAPVPAIQALLKKLQWKIEDVDLFEINEAFAVVAMAAMKDLHIPYDKVNIHGGACALGHPIGASGARIITTLMGALTRTEQKRGIAAVCIGGGEATAIAIERM